MQHFLSHILDNVASNPSSSQFGTAVVETDLTGIPPPKHRSCRRDEVQTPAGFVPAGVLFSTVV